MLLPTAEITIENLTSVQITHVSAATVTSSNATHIISPDSFVKITIPAEKPIHLKLEKISFDNTFMDPHVFLNCENMISLKNNQKLNMYFVGKVPEGPIECRYY